MVAFFEFTAGVAIHSFPNSFISEGFWLSSAGKGITKYPLKNGIVAPANPARM
jgi:hypothetical protein